HTVDILDARFVAKGVLHLYWEDVLADDRGLTNPLRVRCVDFDVRERKWLHARELFRFDGFVSYTNGPQVRRTADGPLHDFWKVDEGAKKGEPSGLYYQSEADGKTVKLAAAVQFRAAVVGDRIVVCYTLEQSPRAVYFRVIGRGAPGPVSELALAPGAEHN